MLYDHLFFLLTERYEKKKDTIEEWIEKDYRQQDTYDNTPAPQSVFCVCGTVMQPENFKDLQSSMDNESLQMLFFFACPKCKKRKAVYEDGEEWIVKPKLCPRCSKKIKETVSRKGGVLTVITTCKACGYKTESFYLSRKFCLSYYS